MVAKESVMGIPLLLILDSHVQTRPTAGVCCWVTATKIISFLVLWDSEFQK